MLRGMAETLKACTAQDPLLQQQAIALGEWVEREGLPEETLESQVAWQVMEHCSGTPGALDLPTLGAFLHIAAETYQPGLPTPLRVTVANVTKWRQDILKWFQHVQDEVLLAQETHLSLEQEKQAKTALRAAGYHSFWSGATDTNLTKGGVVVATKWHAHPRLVHAFTTEGCGFVAVELPRVHWRLVLISVYLRSGVPLQVEPNSTILAELLTVVKNIPNWIAAGDFNIDVKKFASTNIATVARAEIIADGGAAIHSGNTLDYVLASRSVAPLVSLKVDKVVPFSPHFALRLQLDLRHGSIKLPTLRGFGGNLRATTANQASGPSQGNFGVAPPYEATALATVKGPGSTHGDADKPSPGGTESPEVPTDLESHHRPAGCVGEVSLSMQGLTEDFAAFSAEVERHLFGKVKGRGAHNPTVHRPLLQDPGAPMRWHRSPHNLLEQLVRSAAALPSPCEVPGSLQQMAKQHLSHVGPEANWPDWAEMIGVHRDFPVTAAAIDPLQHHSLLEELNRALNFSRLRVSTAEREEYAQWLERSSRGSLKPLFKCIRKHETSVERPFTTFTVAGKLLLRLQQWSQLWRSAGRRPKEYFPDLRQRACRQARELPPLTGVQVQDYLRKLPLKAPGPDGWTPQMARELTPHQCCHLAGIMNRAERDGQFPEQWTVSLIVLLPKNQLIERPIALMHTLLKAWMKLRWQLLDRWLGSFGPRAWWDSCGPGHSCLDIAVRRLVQYESSHVKEEHRVTLFLDLSCFYEMISHTRLVDHARDVAFPPLLLWGALGAYRGPRLLCADGLIGPPAYASRGVLAGCPIAVALSKVALWPACSAVLNQSAVNTADTWVDDLSVDFCGRNPNQVAAKGLRVAKALFQALEHEGLEVSLKKTTWIASSPAVEAAMRKMTHGEEVTISSVAKDLGIANAAGRVRRTAIQNKRLSKGQARSTKLSKLRVARIAHRVRVSKMGSLSAAIWGHQGMGLSPKQMRGVRTQAALAGSKHKLGSVDVVFSLKEGNCCDPLLTVVLQHWRTLHKLLFANPLEEAYERLWHVTWKKLSTAKRRWSLVKGPVAALIAYLQDHDVDGRDPRSWICPAGSLAGSGLWAFPDDTISLEPDQTAVYRVEEGLTRLLQHTANHRICQQDAGEGTEHGVDWTVPRRLLKSQAKKPQHLTALRAVWQGALYTTRKAAKIQCPLCKQDAGLRHVLLECKWWKGRGPAPPPHWDKLRPRWPATSLWVRGLPPAAYTAPPQVQAEILQPLGTGVWSSPGVVATEGLVFGTDATGTSNDPRTRVVAIAVVACEIREGVPIEVGRLTQVLPPGTSVVQGEAMALAMLLARTTGKVPVTTDCLPAIRQAGAARFGASHANVWDHVWRDRHRLACTWHPSHREPAEYLQRYGDPAHWRVKLNDLADQACKEAAEAVPWRQHAATVAQVDVLVEEISHFLAGRAWTLLAGQEAPPLDVKPRNKPRTTLPAKSRHKKHLEQAKESVPQRQHRPGAGGGLNKKQRLENLLAGEAMHGHRFQWSHTNPNNHSLICSNCSLFIQQTHPDEVFGRLEALPCAHRSLPDISRFGLHASHAYYCMGAVLLCTKCYAVHQPGRLKPTKVHQVPCVGSSRDHNARKTVWAKRYLEETTRRDSRQTVLGTAGRPTSDSALGCGRATPAESGHAADAEAHCTQGEGASPTATTRLDGQHEGPQTLSNVVSRKTRAPSAKSTTASTQLPKAPPPAPKSLFAPPQSLGSQQGREYARQNKHSEQQPSTLPDCLLPDLARAHSHDVPLLSPKNVFSGKVSAFAHKPPKAPPGPPFFKLSPAQPVGVAASSREPTPSQPIPQRPLREFFSGAWAGIGNGGGATTPEVGSNTGSAQASLATTTSRPAPESWQTQAAPKTQAGNSKSSTGKAGGLPKTDPTAARKTPRLGRAGAGGGAMARNTPQASQAKRGMTRPGGGTGPAKAQPKKGGQ